MIRIYLNPPTRHCLYLRLIRRPKVRDHNSLLPNLGKVLRARSGSKVSRYFRHIFEHKKIKRLLGANLALLVFVTSQIPTQTTIEQPEENVVSAPTVLLTTERPVQYPVANVKISQEYKLFHPGIDFDGVTGEEVRPIMSGRVEAINRSKTGYGNSILVNHGGERSSLYAHLSKISVYEGQEVTTRTKIGGIGATGHAKGDHLHLEIREDGKPINPYSVLPR